MDWLKAKQEAPQPTLAGGASGYFSPPADRLDPSLFDPDDKINSTARGLIIGRLVGFLQRELGLKGTENWLYVWLAGSGITYQWNADRGNGDLDVLLGVNRTAFNQANPDFAGLGESELATWLDAALKSRLWPTMASTNIGGKSFEVTYFYNAGTGTDIRNINPYAAYDLKNDVWVVKPPQETAATHHFPKEWFESAAQDTADATDILRRYNEADSELSTSAEGSASFLNAGSKLNVISAQAQQLMDAIHHGRRAAFQEGGEGYLSWPNFRWQQAKGSGTIKALSEIIGISERAEEDQERKLYGSTLKSSDDLLLRAMLGRRATP